MSPDGKQVAYALAVWDKPEDNRKSDVWIVPTDGKGKPAKLTFDRANDHKLKWSADGKQIYFLSNRKKASEVKPPFDGSSQVWRIAADGSGEVKAITREAGGIRATPRRPTPSTSAKTRTRRPGRVRKAPSQVEGRVRPRDPEGERDSQARPRHLAHGEGRR